VGSRFGSVDHREKSRWDRPAFTCPTTSHDTGEMREYHGQRVSPEWQS